MAADLAAARDFYSDLAEALKKVPDYTYATAKETKPARDAAIKAVVDLIHSKGGRVKQDWQGAAVSLYGLRATSTSGVLAACRNWMTQVTLKSAAERT